MKRTYFLILCLSIFCFQCVGQVSINGKQYKVEHYNKSDSLVITSFSLFVKKNTYDLEIDGEINVSITLECGTGFDDPVNEKWGSGMVEKEKDTLTLYAVHQCHSLVMENDSVKANKIEVYPSFFKEAGIKNYRYRFATGLKPMSSRTIKKQKDKTDYFNLQFWSKETIYSFAGYGKPTEYKLIAFPIFNNDCRTNQNLNVEARIVFLSKERAKLELFNVGLISIFIDSIELTRVK